jgi:hypothetical protein
MVVDVSVEVTVLARSMGVPVVGRRRMVVLWGRAGSDSRVRRRPWRGGLTAPLP